MRKALLILMLVAQAFTVGCSSLRAASVARRQPLERNLREYKTPTNYPLRVRGNDPKTGDPITYDHKPRVEILDAKTRKYALKWIGFDGREKTATFQSGDAVDVVISASVSRKSSGEYLYSYEVKNLPSSGAYLKRFIIQNLAPDVEPEKNGQLMPFLMSRNIPTFSEGNWLMFADVSDDVEIDPGQTVTVHLTSASQPGVVRCLASAETVVDGADEDTPADLDSLLVGFSEYPHGFTIGPVANLRNLSEDERAKYLLDKLPDLRKAGWITDEAQAKYEQLLKNGDLQGALKQIQEDSKNGQVTSEVLAIIEAFK